jgi:thymidylate kinase
VLRNYEGLPQEPGRDVDLLTNDFAGLERILYQVAHASGYRVRIFRRYDSLVKFFLLSTSDDGFASLEIDVAWDIRWKGIPLAPRDFLEKNRLRREQVYTLKPGAEAVVTLTKGLFYQGAVQDKYQASLPAMVRENEGGFISTLAGSLGEPLAHKLAELTNRGAWPELAAQAPVLKRQAIWRALAVHPWAQIRDWATFIYRGLWKFIRPGGLFVALIGPDGSGKSTITEGLQQSLKPLFHSSRSCHAHFKILPRLRDLMGFFGFRRSEEESTEAENPEVPPATIGRFRSIFYLLYYTLDYMLGLPVILRARGRGELIIFDRYFYDYLIQKGLSLPPGLLWQVLKIIPQPDAVIYLQNDPDTILSRKRELSRQEVERQAQMCREIISRLPQGFIIPTAGSPAETVATVTRAIIDRVMLKNPGKNSLIGSSEGRAIFSETS